VGVVDPNVYKNIKKKKRFLKSYIQNIILVEVVEDTVAVEVVEDTVAVEDIVVVEDTVAVEVVEDIVAVQEIVVFVVEGIVMVVVNTAESAVGIHTVKLLGVKTVEFVVVGLVVVCLVVGVDLPNKN
jgi:hypothetical protein